MLNLMRKHSRSWLIKVLLGTIIIVFVFFYGWGYMERKAGLIASINGTNISIKSYEEYYRNLLENFRSRGNENPTEDILKDLRKVAFENMIKQILVLQEAEKLNISVALDEIKDHVRRLPEFQRNGQFDRSLYLRILKLSRISPSEFEMEQKKEILVSKAQNLIMDNVKVSDQEVLDHYRWSNEKLILSFLQIDPSSFMNEATPDDKALEDYFNEHQSQFMIPEKAKVDALLFDPAKYRNRIRIEENKIKEIYELNVDKYRVPERVSLRHILIKTLPTDDATTRTNALKKAEEVLEKAKKGEDFSKLAEIYSDDENTAHSGGYLGSVEKGQLLKPIDEAAFSMKKGEISRIIKSAYGFHILKIDDIQSPRTRSFKEVEPELKEEMLLQRSKDLASKEADEAFISLIEGDSMGKVAKQFKVPHIKTPFFSVGEKIPDIDADENFYKAAFEVKPDDIHEVIESRGRFYIIKGIETEPPRVPELVEVKQKVQAAYLKEKAKANALKKANEVIEKLQKGQSLALLAKELGIDVKETGSFSRLYRGYIPSLGYSDEIFNAAFSLSQKDPVLKTPYWIDDRWVIVALKERIGINQDSFKKDRKTFFARLLLIKRNEALQAWIEALKKKAKIEKYKAYNLI